MDSGPEMNAKRERVPTLYIPLYISVSNNCAVIL